MNFPVIPTGRGHSCSSCRTEMGVPRARRNASTLSHAGSDSQPAAPLKETFKLPTRELCVAGHDDAAAHGNPALRGCTSVATLRCSPRSCTAAPSAPDARRSGPVLAVLAWRSSLRGALPARKSRAAGRHWPWTGAGKPLASNHLPPHEQSEVSHGAGGRTAERSNGPGRPAPTRGVA